MPNVVHNEPSHVTAESGCVLVTGPGGVVVSFTPEAAADTSGRLLSCAAKAMGQRVEEQRTEAEKRLK